MLETSFGLITIASLTYSYYLYKTLAQADAAVTRYKKEIIYLSSTLKEQQKTFQLISAEIKNQKPVGYENHEGYTDE